MRNVEDSRFYRAALAKKLQIFVTGLDRLVYIGVCPSASKRYSN